MKKLNVILGASLLLMATSCNVQMATSTSMPIDASITSRSTADLIVSQEKVSTKYFPTKQERKMGLGFIQQNAAAELLEKNGNADVLVNPQYVIEKKFYLLRSKILSVKVTGYPAFFKNIKPAEPQKTIVNQVVNN